MLSILKQLHSEWLARSGRRLAIDEFEHLASKTWTVKQAEDYRGDALSNTAFRHGWIGGWMSQGAIDATRGICRAREFRNHGYILGWRNKVLEMHKAGWRHERLDRELIAIDERYWKKIVEGTNEVYFE
jgi:hypothetical protein